MKRHSIGWSTLETYIYTSWIPSYYTDTRLTTLLRAAARRRFHDTHSIRLWFIVFHFREYRKVLPWRHNTLPNSNSESQYCNAHSIITEQKNKKKKRNSCPYRSYPNISGGFPVLTDITGYYTEMFYSLNTTVRGIQYKNMVERAWKGKICWKGLMR